MQQLNFLHVTCMHGCHCCRQHALEPLWGWLRAGHCCRPRCRPPLKSWGCQRPKAGPHRRPTAATPLPTATALPTATLTAARPYTRALLSRNRKQRWRPWAWANGRILGQLAQGDPW